MKTVSRPDGTTNKPESEYTELANAVPAEQVTEAVKKLAIDSNDLEKELAEGVHKVAGAPMVI